MPSLDRPNDMLRDRRRDTALTVACAAGLGVAALALFARGRSRTQSGGPPARPAPLAGHTRAEAAAPGGRAASVAAARGLNGACGMLAASVLLDSALEHYRADFFDPFMYAPIVSSALTLAVSAHGAADGRESSHTVRHAVHAGAGLVGLAGGGFHAWNVRRREGGFAFQNLFYAAPLGAPYALVLAGLLGAAAEQVRDTDPDEPMFLGVPADRALAAISGLGILGSVGEAGLLHFRGAFQNPAMLIPVTLPPVAAALLLKAALEPKRRGRSYRLTRAWLGATAVVGIAGVVFHAYGVARMMGGWRNWSQNMIDGPPLPAPPAFTGLALAGMAALRLMEPRGHE